MIDPVYAALALALAALALPGFGAGLAWAMWLLLPLGFASGEVPQIPANILLVKNMSVLGFYLGGYAKLHPRALGESFDKLMGWYLEGRLKPHVSNVLPLEAANEGLDLLRTRQATGKVVIEVS